MTKLTKVAVQTRHGLATAVLQSAKHAQPNPLTGNSVREIWRIELTLGDVAIASITLPLDPSTMSETYLRDWASIQTAEGYEANREECLRLAGLCDG